MELQRPGIPQQLADSQRATSPLRIE